MAKQPSPDRASPLRPSSGYRKLRSFQMAEIVFDATMAFCEQHVKHSRRFRDQMEQAARSGRQNIAEGSCAAATSGKSELYLTNVAKSSLHELLLDYEDYLRHRDQPLWDKDSPEALAVRHVVKDHEPVKTRYAAWLEQPDPVLMANALICLTNQAIYLLRRQVEALERRLIEEGGYGEQLYAARTARRAEQGAVKATDADAPVCPDCGKPMAQRTARKGPRAGKPFWGCADFPKCRGTRPIVGDG